ncbi:MAG: glycosyltransferase family 9 protein [Luteibaculaceae bacterium]
MRILIARTDSIGDVMLTLPLCGFLKKTLPEVEIYFLGKSYTEAIITSCTFVDHFLNWDNFAKNPPKAAEALKRENIDAAVLVYPDKLVAKVLAAAEIPKRIGTSHRFFNWLYCNIRPNFTRKNSNLHESELNFSLLEPLFDGNFKRPKLHDMHTYVGFEPKFTLPEWVLLKLELNKQKPLVILHPKSKGSAVEWGLPQFKALAEALSTEFFVVITGTKEEGALIGDVFTHLPVENFTGKLSLPEFIALIEKSEALVAASTGPLHIASALHKKAIGLYAPLQPIHPGRWAPIGENAIALTSKPGCDACKKPKDCNCVKDIRIETIIDTIKA